MFVMQCVLPVKRIPDISPNGVEEVHHRSTRASSRLDAMMFVSESSNMIVLVMVVSLVCSKFIH